MGAKAITMTQEQENTIRKDVPWAVALVPNIEMHNNALALVGASREDIRLILQSRTNASTLLAELDATRARLAVLEAVNADLGVALDKEADNLAGGGR